MKFVALALLVTAMLCNSTLAMAEGPVPFRALMQDAGAKPGGPPIPDAKNQAEIATQLARTGHMTTGGKIMVGVGASMLAIGGVLFAWPGKITPNDKHELYGAGGATMGVGAILIVLGTHRRSY
jgi:hypothetical protein